MSSQRRALLTALWLLMHAASHTALSQGNEGDFAFDANEKYQAEISHQMYEKCNVKRLWGVPDMTAYVGRVFKLQIPTEAFSGKISFYKFQTSMHGPLPKWLVVDKHKGLLRGIPGIRDIGDNTLMITAVPYPNHNIKCPAATDVFTIEVKDKREIPSLASDVTEQCHVRDEEIHLKIVINRSIDQITQKQKLTAINNLANFMALDYRAILIQTHSPATEDVKSVMFSGVGNKKNKTNKYMTELQLTVGCSGKLWPKHSILVHQIRSQAKDGTISNLIHLPVVSWEVVSSKQTPLNRKQRAAADDLMEASADGSEDYTSGDLYDEEDGEYEDEVDPATTPRAQHPPEPPTVPPTETKHHHRHHHGESILTDANIPTLELATTDLYFDPLVTPPTDNTQPPLPPPPPPSTASPAPDSSTSDPVAKIPESTLPAEITTLDDTSQMETETSTPPFSPRYTTDTSEAPSPTADASKFESTITLAVSPVTQPNEDTATTLIATTVNANVVQDYDDPISSSTTERIRAISPTEIAKKYREPDLFNLPTTEDIENATIPELPTNTPPTVTNPIKSLSASMGELFIFEVPFDTFSVTEGMPPELLLESASGYPVEPENWLQFDSKSQQFFGVPMDKDLGEREYNLVAKYASGYRVSDSIKVHVIKTDVQATVEFQMVVDTPYDRFEENPLLLRKFVEKLQTLFNDEDYSTIKIKRVARSAHGHHTVISWYNTTLPTDRYAQEEIDAIRSVLSDGTNVTDRVHNVMGGDFSVISVNSADLGKYATPKMVPPTEAYVTSTESSSTIFGRTTETIEFTLPANNPPQIQHRTKKVPVTAGKYFSYIIPDDLFNDTEDGTNLRLAMYDVEHVPLTSASWVQFNPQNREVYGLPLEEHVSKWEYIIEATDSRGASVKDTLDITVQQHKGRRTVNHEFSMKLRVSKKYPAVVDWQIRALKGLVSLFRDTDMDQITVRHVNVSSDPIEFIWTNDTLPKAECPKADIDRLMGILQSNNDDDPSNALISAMSPELIIKSVTWKGTGSCQGPPSTPDTPGVPDQSSNFSPIVRNRIKSLRATVGELFLFKVPADTFYDHESVKTGLPLKLGLMKLDKSPIHPHHWLQFDSNNQEFYGIPMEKDFGEKGYQLICEDLGGLTASDSLMVNVQHRVQLNATVEFRMTIDTPYETFAQSALMKRKFIENLGALFEDKDLSSIRIWKISRFEHKQTVISWYNASLPTIRCPDEEIEQLQKILIENKSLTNRVHNAMGEFSVVSVSFVNTGACAIGRLVPPIEPTIVPPVYSEDASKPVGADDYIITFIVPIIVIVCMILIATLIACILYRRRRSGKMTVGDEEERQAFRSKGIPVIFQDELDEKPDPSNKTPIIMKEEKPPLLPPPEYKGADSGSPTPSHTPYLPPPPFTASRDNTRNNRPKPTPSYRKPPPYVPP